MTNQLIENRIRKNEIFSQCNNDAIEVLIKNKIVQFNTGDLVPYEYSNCIGIVLVGKLEAIDSNNNGTSLNFFIEGDIFGAAVVFLDKNDISKIKAVKKSSVLFIDEPSLEKVFAIDPNVAVSYAKFLSKKIQFLSKKILSFTAPSIDSAICRYLRDILLDKDSAKINVSQLSKTLDAGRTSIYRSLSNLCEEKIITFTNGVVTIINREGLEKRI